MMYNAQPKFSKCVPHRNRVEYTDILLFILADFQSLGTEDWKKKKFLQFKLNERKSEPDEVFIEHL